MDARGTRSKGRKRLRSRRALLSRVAQLLLVLAALCFFFAAALTGYAFLVLTNAARQAQVHLAFIYLVAALVLLLLRGITVFAQKRITRRGRLPHDDLAPAEPRSEWAEKSGAVLLLTLFVLALLAALLANLQLTTFAARRMAEAQLRRDRLRLAATDAVQNTMEWLRDTAGALPDDLTNAPWASPRDFTFPEGIIARVKITDEQRFFDLNNVIFGEKDGMRYGGDILMDLMTLCGDFTPVDKVEALVDWIDEDHNGFRETPFYQSRPQGHGAANRRLYALREVLQVDGFSRDLFLRRPFATPGEPFKANLIDCVTVIPTPRSQPVPVNINSASREVLLALLGLAQDKTVDELLVTRRVRPIASVDGLGFLIDPAVLSPVLPYLSVATRLYRLEARAFQDGAAADLRAVVRHNPAGYVEVLQWALQ